MMTVEPGCDLLSLSKLCELFQTTPRKVEQAASLAGAEPVLKLNGTLYWDAEGADAIRQAITK